jgi:hypothetical protein
MIIWTASSDAALQPEACGEAAAAARWRNAQAVPVTFYRPISKSKSGEMRWILTVMGKKGLMTRAPAVRRAAEAACEAAGGNARRRLRAKRYGEGPMPWGSATMPQSIAEVEMDQAVWPGTGARRSGLLCGLLRGLRVGGGEPSGVTSVWREDKPAELREDRYWRSIMGINHVQICVSSVGVQARRSAMEGS